jgi:hypothetical protein
MTPKSVWEAIKHIIPKKKSYGNLFYGDGRDHLQFVKLVDVISIAGRLDLKTIFYGWISEMPCLLLDVDGVVVRDRSLMAHVRHNAAAYVGRKLPSCKDPKLTNNYLVMAHGHTARGLQRNFNIDASDFNEQVYDKSLMTHLTHVLGSKTFQRDAETVNNMILQGWPVTLFSNAPYEWVRPVALAISDRVKIRCPGPDLNKAFMKPEKEFYKEFDDCKDYYFVDDSPKNLEAVRGMKNWYPIHFTEDPNPHHWCPQVGSLSELHASILGYSVRNIF